jgi:hypothetical protein
MPKNFFPEHIQEYAKMFLLQEAFNEQFRDFTETELEFMPFALPLKTDTEKATENWQMELLDLQRDTTLIQKSSETQLQIF